MRQRLVSMGVWLSSDAFHMVRLLGHHAINMADNFEVAGVFLASLTLRVAPKNGPERESFDWKHAMIRMMLTFEAESDLGDVAAVTKHCDPFARRLAELPLARMAPKDDEQARLWLTSVIDREMGRLIEIRAMLQAIADADLAEAPTRLAFETGAEGDKHRRYVLSNERVLNRRLTLFLETRKRSEAAVRDAMAVDRRPLSASATFDQPDLSWSAASGPSSVDACDQADMANLNPVEPMTRLEPLARDEAECWEVPDWEQQMERATLTAESADPDLVEALAGLDWSDPAVELEADAVIELLNEGRDRETYAERLEGLSRDSDVRCLP